MFYDARRNQQVKSSIVRTRANGSTAFIDFIGNAAEGTNKGVEVETNWAVSGDVSVFASVGLLDARFDRCLGERKVHVLD